MEITLIGYILIPVGLASAIVAPINILLYLLIFFAPFTASAVVNITSPSFGLQPGYFFGLLFIGRFGLESLLQRRDFFQRIQGMVVVPLWIFCLVAFISIVLIPFYSGVYVHRPSGQTELLKLSKENITQYVYVVYVVLVTTCIAFSRLRPEDVHKCLMVFILSGLFVSFWGWFQVTSFYMGYSYPDYIFNNSVSFSQNYFQFLQAIGLKRMNSVAPEPSMLARFLLIPTFISLYCAYNRGFLVSHRCAIILASFFSITLLCTTSATAAFGFVGGLLIFIFLITFIVPMFSDEDSNRIGANRSIKSIVVVSTALGIMGAFVFALAVWKLGFSVDRLVAFANIVMFEKLESQSGETRLGSALAGLSLFFTHPLLGVGWGSNRTFDMLTNLLSTTGIIGTLLFFAAHFALLWCSLRLIRLRALTPNPVIRSYFEVMLLALMVRIFGKFLSEPGLTFLDHWILVGLMCTSLSWFRWVPSLPRCRDCESSQPTRLCSNQ